MGYFGSKATTGLCQALLGLQPNGIQFVVGRVSLFPVELQLIAMFV